MGRVSIRAGVGVVAALALSSCGTAVTRSGLPRPDWDSGSATRSTPAPADCAQQSVRTSPGAPDAWGLTVGDATTPAWLAKAGYLGASTVGRWAFEALPDGCVTAVDVSSGAVAWTHPVGAMYALRGVVAGASVVVAATGHTEPGAAAFPVTDRLTGLDPRTGSVRWSLDVGADGQGVPATIVGDVVVVTEADGSVLGLDATSGVRRWRDAPPAACATSADPTDPVNPAAVVLTGVPVPTIRYNCGRRHEVARLDPATGAALWTRTMPRLPSEEIGWYPAAATRDVVGLVLGGRPAAVAPLRRPAPPGPGGYETFTFLALDARTGRPLWQLDGLPAGDGVYAGAGQLCFVSDYGTGCYGALGGGETWHREPPVLPSDEHGFGDGAVAAAGRLYTVVPTEAASAIPQGSTTYQSQPGTFHLQVTDMASGRIVGDEPLPAYYGGAQGVVVSADTPPGVVAVAAGTVLVSPQLHESDVIEALPDR